MRDEAAGSTGKANGEPASEAFAYSSSSDLERALEHHSGKTPAAPAPATGAAAHCDRTRWAWWAATVFGAGFLKPGPGTYGSVAAAVLWLLAGWVVHHNGLLLTEITAVAVVLATAIGIPAATRTAREAGREDPGFVVIDEVAGQWLALLFVPPLWTDALVAVLLFRFFDILKPWPIRRFEDLPEGTGIMADDLVAGLFALGGMQLVLHFLRPLQ